MGQVTLVSGQVKVWLQHPNTLHHEVTPHHKVTAVLTSFKVLCPQDTVQDMQYEKDLFAWQVQQVKNGSVVGSGIDSREIDDHRFDDLFA